MLLDHLPCHSIPMYPLFDLVIYLYPLFFYILFPTIADALPENLLINVDLFLMFGIPLYHYSNFMTCSSFFYIFLTYFIYLFVIAGCYITYLILLLFLLALLLCLFLYRNLPIYPFLFHLLHPFI